MPVALAMTTYVKSALDLSAALEVHSARIRGLQVGKPPLDPLGRFRQLSCNLVYFRNQRSRSARHQPINTVEAALCKQNLNTNPQLVLCIVTTRGSPKRAGWSLAGLLANDSSSHVKPTGWR